MRHVGLSKCHKYDLLCIVKQCHLNLSPPFNAFFKIWLTFKLSNPWAVLTWFLSARNWNIKKKIKQTIRIQLKYNKTKLIKYFHPIVVSRSGIISLLIPSLYKNQLLLQSKKNVRFTSYALGTIAKERLWTTLATPFSRKICKLDRLVCDQDCNWGRNDKMHGHRVWLQVHRAT